MGGVGGVYGRDEILLMDWVDWVGRDRRGVLRVEGVVETERVDMVCEYGCDGNGMNARFNTVLAVSSKYYTKLTVHFGMSAS